MQQEGHRTSASGLSSSKRSTTPSVNCIPEKVCAQASLQSLTLIRIDLLHWRCVRVGIIRIFQGLGICDDGLGLNPQLAVPALLVLHGGRGDEEMGEFRGEWRAVGCAGRRMQDCGELWTGVAEVPGA